MILVIDGEVAVPDFKQFHEADTYVEAMVAIADSVAPRAKVSRREPELVGVAAWWAQVPATLKDPKRNWSETTSFRGNWEPWTAEQKARQRYDQEAAYVALGYSQAWATWYVKVLTPHYQHSRRGPSRREEYALYVSSGSGPAVDKLAKKLAPARKRSA